MRGVIVPLGPHHTMAWGTIVVSVIISFTALVVLIALVLWIRYSIKYRAGK
jgi:hypothetical protein